MCIRDRYYLRARYYQAGSGRVWTRDTWGLDQQNPREWNRYVYVAADPVNGVDPFGLFVGEYALKAAKAKIVSGGLYLVREAIVEVIAQSVGDLLATEARLIYEDAMTAALRKADARGVHLPSGVRNALAATISRADVPITAGKNLQILSVNDIPPPQFTIGSPKRQAFNYLKKLFLESFEEIAQEAAWDFVIGKAGEHAEEAAIKHMQANGWQPYRPDQAAGIGVSNPGGPCDSGRNCRNLVQQLRNEGYSISVRWLDRLGKIINPF